MPPRLTASCKAEIRPFLNGYILVSLCAESLLALSASPRQRQPGQRQERAPKADRADTLPQGSSRARDQGWVWVLLVDERAESERE